MHPAHKVPAPAGIAAAQAEATRLAEAAGQRQAQNDKAHQVRLDTLSRRDPLMRAVIKDYRQHIADLAAAKAALASLTTELDAVKTQAADESAQLRTELAAALKKSRPAGGQ